MEDLSEMLHRLMLEDTPSVDQLTECFRNLRNHCASSLEVRNKLGQQDSVLKDADTVINIGLNEASSDKWIHCLRICAQFLGNLSVNNPKNQEIIWSRFSSKLKRMANHGDAKLTNICLMVLYNILLGRPNLTSQLADDQQFVTSLCKSGAYRLEYAQFVVERMLLQGVDWTKLYSQHKSPRERLFVLDMVMSCVEQSPGSVPVRLVTQLASQFCRDSDFILSTAAARMNMLESMEVVTLMRLLASCSAHPFHLPALQQNRSFFINCVFLLKSIHMAGKEPGSYFCPVTKLSKENDRLQFHPAFGFKADLVRVLGNLCWRHKHNQETLRELEIIPLLLDCCNIDAKNPFIIQWVVLAVRNLCEGNLENQAVIASMTREGLVESSVLTNLGLTLHSDQDNNELCIAPLYTGEPPHTIELKDVLSKK